MRVPQPVQIRIRRSASLPVALLLAVLAVPASSAASVATFSSKTPITIPSLSNANPYPSTIAASSDLTGPVRKATVTLQGFSHTCPNDVSALLVAPTGASSILMSHVGNGQLCPDSSNANLTFDDTATASVPYPPVTGAYKPTAEDALATFTAPAPPPPYPVALSSFVGTAPSGTWSLFVNDDSGGDDGSIAQGWSLNLTAASSAFEFGKLKRNKRAGTATLVVEVPDPGTLTLTGKGLVKQRVARASRATASKTVSAAGKVKLKIKSKGNAKRKLNSTGKAKAKAKVTFTPTGGTPKTQKKKLTLKKRL